MMAVSVCSLGGGGGGGGRPVCLAGRRHHVPVSARYCPGIHRHTFNDPVKYTARTLSHMVHAALGSFSDAATVPVLTADGTQISPDITMEPGVYAVYDSSGTLQYVGISRKVAVSMATHAESLGPDMVCSARVGEMPGAGKEELTEAWKAWIESAVEETGGSIPPGNAPGESMWTQRKRRIAKQEIKLTPGKGLDDLTCSISDLIDQVVKTNRVVAFVKGTRYEPACGFSYKVLTTLTEISGQDFEVVNVLDEVYNPGLRDAIKEYSQWPTIPQVYVEGEFIGGADIIEEMHTAGELAALLKKQSSS